MTISTSDLLEILERLAVAAGAEIMAVRAQKFDVAEKSDGSPVTLADKRAETVVVAGLVKNFPDIPIVAEEMVAAGDIPGALGDQFFLVDALDGTREFCAGREEFTVNIAMVNGNIPVAGVIYCPCARTLFAGVHDGNGKGHAHQRKVSASGEMGEARPLGVRVNATPPVIMATRSHMTPETQAWLDARPDAKLQSIGSSLKFCKVAAGEADLYPRFGTTMEWDTAAGDAILRAAGGSTKTEDGAALRYGKRGQTGMADFQNPFFVSRGG
jgi:3'(2'), 5'-bisphosphate nucleotidase